MSQTAAKSTALTAEQAKEHLRKIQGWQLSSDAKEISKRYSFKNFAEALAFVNRLGEVAEASNHHPDLTLGWGYAGVSYTTHDIGGLHENDFAMAEKTDAIYHA
jgi:4a-hydroxytetrahydrobiopterin dehydratase